jgi:hypothetical protein
MEHPTTPLVKLAGQPGDPHAERAQLTLNAIGRRAAFDILEADRRQAAHDRLVQLTPAAR